MKYGFWRPIFWVEQVWNQIITLQKKDAIGVFHVQFIISRQKRPRRNFLSTIYGFSSAVQPVSRMSILRPDSNKKFPAITMQHNESREIVRRYHRHHHHNFEAASRRRRASEKSECQNGPGIRKVKTVIFCAWSRKIISLYGWNSSRG